MRRYHVTDVKDEHGNVVGKSKTRRPCCPKCGNFVTLKASDQALKCRAIIGKTTRADGAPEDIRCGEPLYQKSRLHRWPLADYIAKQAKGRFQTLICDEVHKSKGGDTDIGRAFHQLTLATKYTINLTGTLFGGKSTDLFYLLYRLMPAVRAKFGFRDATRWAETYGRLEHTLVQDDDDDSTRHFSGRKKVVAESVKEKPGISPRIYQLLLQTTIFLQIQDLGYKLPPYEEQVVTLDMSATQQAQYEWLDKTLYDTIIGGLKSFSAVDMKISRQLLSVWLTETLYQPNAGFRSRPILWVPPHPKGTKKEHEPWLLGEPVSADYGYTTADDDRAIAAGAKPLPLPPGDRRGFISLGEQWEKYNAHYMHLYPTCQVDELLPKEEWLVQFCVQEKQANRKTIVGVQQTAKRDIQPRLLSILGAHGIRAAVLPDELAPEKREAWIAQRAPGIDVLLTNPKKVETGLDLIAFANLIVYELPTSLFTLAQFVRRVWRLGQTQAVRTYYLIYRDTMEHRMLGLVAQKVMAAALLYGDNASTAMSAEAETDDLLAELAKAALNQLPIETGIRAIMAPTMQQDATVEVLDDVDAAELAADFDAEEQAADQVAEPDEPAVAIGMSEAAQDAEYTVPWWQQWQNLAQAAAKPAKRSKRAAAPTPPASWTSSPWPCSPRRRRPNPPHPPARTTPRWWIRARSPVSSSRPCCSEPMPGPPPGSLPRKGQLHHASVRPARAQARHPLLRRQEPQAGLHPDRTQRQPRPWPGCGRRRHPAQVLEDRGVGADDRPHDRPGPAGHHDRHAAPAPQSQGRQASQGDKAGKTGKTNNNQVGAPAKPSKHEKQNQELAATHAKLAPAAQAPTAVTTVTPAATTNSTFDPRSLGSDRSAKVPVLTPTTPRTNSHRRQS